MLGTNSFGLPIHFDRNAFEADGIILLNRIKPHTSFTGRYESGLLKMLTIGLGKRQGAAQVHKLGLPGLCEARSPKSGRSCSRKRRWRSGVAILENAREETARIVAVEPEDILEVEPKLLDEARDADGPAADRPDRRAGRRRAGQELQRHRSRPQRDRPPASRDDARPAPPVITRLAVLDLSHETRGNALGIGLADLTTERLVRGIDPTPMRVNSLTSNFLTRARVPLALPTDRDVIATSLDTCWRIDEQEARMVLIPNTLELTTFWVIAALADRGRRPPGAQLRDRLSPDSVRSARETSSRKSCFRRASERGGIDLDPRRRLRSRWADVRHRGPVLPRCLRGLADRGKAFTPEIMKQFIGRRAAEVAQSWKTLAGVEEPVEDFLADVGERFLCRDGYGRASDARALCLARPSAPRWHCRPRSRPRRGHSYADRLLVRHGLRDRFEFVLASEDVTRGKPDPEIYQLAAAAVRRAGRVDARARGQPGGPGRRQGCRRLRRGSSARAQPRGGTRRRRPDRRPARRSFTSSPDRISRRETSTPMSHPTDPEEHDRAERCRRRRRPSQARAAHRRARRAGSDILPYVVPMFAYVGLTSLEGYLPQLLGKPSPAWYPIAVRRQAVIVVLLAWHYRATWSDFRPRPRAATIVLGVLTGLFVCAAWVGLDGHYPTLHVSGGSRSAFDPTRPRRRSRDGPLSLCRLLGLVVVVPVIEELFWRSFLLRWMIDNDFLRVPIGKVTPMAAAVTSGFFGLAHPEWLPALLTGALWAWLLWWTRSLSACLISHATANLALGVYVIVTHEWKFW